MARALFAHSQSIENQEKFWNLDPKFDKNSSLLINYVLHKNYTSDRHKHNFYEINIVQSGTGIHIIDKQEFKCKRGDIFIIPPFVSHQYISNGDLNVHNVMISDLWMKHYASDLAVLPGFYSIFNPLPVSRPDDEYSVFLCLNENDILKLDKFVSNLNLYYLCGAPFSDAYITCSSTLINSYGLAIVSAICVHYEEYSKNGLTNANRSKYINDFAKSLHYIYSHYNEKISVATLAKEASMSYSSYNRIFKEWLNTSPLNYINQYRIAVAKYYLKKGLSVIETAAITGFFDHSHFTKAFVKETGITPAEYKKGGKQMQNRL